MGQSNKCRECPAVGRSIPAAECGEKRMSVYACPESCPFNPWTRANAEQIIKTADALFSRLEYRRQAEMPKGAPRPEPADAAAGLTATQLLMARHDVGAPFFQRWAADGWAGLSNDARFLLDAQAAARPMILETLQRLDSRFCLMRDRLDPAAPPFVLLDPQLAQKKARFAACVTLVTPLPGLQVGLLGTLATIAPAGSLEPEEIVGAIAQHAGGPAAGEPLRAWLVGRITCLDDVLGDLEDAMDAGTNPIVPWERHASERLHDRQEAGTAQLDDDDAFGAGESAAADPVDGFSESRLLLVQHRFAKTGPRLAAGRELAGEVLLDDGKTLVREVTAEDSQELLSQAGVPHCFSAPPSLMALAAAPPAIGALGAATGQEAPAVLDELIAKWPDVPLPALDNLSPRQAAGVPERRGLLVRLVKLAIRQADQLARPADLAGFARELGLTELDFPLPATWRK